MSGNLGKKILWGGGGDRLCEITFQKILIISHDFPPFSPEDSHDFPPFSHLALALRSLFPYNNTHAQI